MINSSVEAVLQTFSKAIDDQLIDNRDGNERISQSKVNALVKKFTSQEKDNTAGKVRPWSREDFIDRLRTFTSSSWFAKADCISAVQCARFGWVNINFDELKCLSCNSTISHEVDDPEGKRLASTLSSGHYKCCGWNDNPSSMEIIYLPVPLMIPEILLQTFCLHYKRNSEKLKSYGDFANEIHFEIPQELVSLLHSFPSSTSRDLDKMSQSNSSSNIQMAEMRIALKVFCDLLAAFPPLSSPTISDSINPDSSHPRYRLEDIRDSSHPGGVVDITVAASILLTLFGWNVGEKDSVPSSDSDQHPTDRTSSSDLVLCCEHCFRTVRLSHFCLKRGDAVNCPQSYSDGDEAIPRLNPLRQHALWCPWANRIPTDASGADTRGVGHKRTLSQGVSSSGTKESEPGWILLTHAILDKVSSTQVTTTANERGVWSCDKPSKIDADALEKDGWPEEVYKKIRSALDDTTESSRFPLYSLLLSSSSRRNA